MNYFSNSRKSDIIHSSLGCVYLPGFLFDRIKKRKRRRSVLTLKKVEVVLKITTINLPEPTDV